MRIVLQRVVEASVKINESIKGSVDKGLLLFLGIEAEDNEEDIDWLVQKVSNLRVFEDENGKMNLSVKEIEGEVFDFSIYIVCLH